MISRLANIYEDETCWIIGTGPSLDGYDLSKIDGPVIALNRAVSVVLNLLDVYWIVMDDWRTQQIPGDWELWLSDTLSGCMTGVFLDPMFGARRVEVPAPVDENIVRFKRPADRGDPKHLLTDLNTETLYQFCGTAATAVHLASIFGCKDIVLVGIDGGGGNAEKLEKHYDNCPRRDMANYQLARMSALDAADILGLTITEDTKNVDEI